MTREKSMNGKNGRRKNIALFMGILENEISAAILEGAAKGAQEIGADLIVFPMDIIDAAYSDTDVNSYRYQNNTLDTFLSVHHIDGIVIEYGTVVSAMSDDQKKGFLDKIGAIPTILLSEDAEGYSSLCVDNRVGLKELIEHLIDVHYCSQICYLSGPKDNHDAQERLDVYRRVVRERGLDLDEGWVVYGNFSVYVEELVTDFVRRHPGVEAIVCANDHMAMGACAAIKKLGLIPGKDILVTGFDDIMPALLMNPSLTTVKADPELLSYRAVLALEHPKDLTNLQKVPTRMILRESCGCGCENSIGGQSEHPGDANPSDWRESTRARLLENARRSSYEHELGNVTRQMVFFHENEADLFLSILKTLKRLQIDSCYIFLFDTHIPHRKGMNWTMPEQVNLMAYYRGEEVHTFEYGEKVCVTRDLFGYDFFDSEEREDYVTVPLFFGENQMGYLVAGAQSGDFQYIFQMAGQISNTLAIINILKTQERMKQELAEANQSKSQFLANMSHEIRTPINAIIGFNEMILRESREEAISEYAVDVKSAADTLLVLVNEILDFSKIEAGKMTLVMSEYRLHDLINDSLSMIDNRARKKGLELKAEYDAKLPDGLYGDDGRLRQILLNLLTNAVKYTDRGSVTLKVSGQRKEQEILLTFAVQDTGIGIKEEDIEHLFHEFERIEERRNRHIEGTGLGINISAGLLALMGSRLRVKSVYNEGSEFFFTVSQQIVDDTPLEKAFVKTSEKNRDSYVPEFTAPDARILVVDDNRMNRKVIRNLVKGTLIQMEEADSGRACLEMVENNHYDLVLLDHMMPEMDGIETLRAMQRMETFAGHETPVIALTANAIAGVEEMYLECGFDDYLSKPVHPDLLNRLLLKYIDPVKVTVTSI